jgi:hypothetical protein
LYIGSTSVSRMYSTIPPAVRRIRNIVMEVYVWFEVNTFELPSYTFMAPP